MILKNINRISSALVPDTYIQNPVMFNIKRVYSRTVASICASSLNGTKIRLIAMIILMLVGGFISNHKSASKNEIGQSSEKIVNS